MSLRVKLLQNSLDAYYSYTDEKRGKAIKQLKTEIENNKNNRDPLLKDSEILLTLLENKIKKVTEKFLIGLGN